MPLQNTNDPANRIRPWFALLLFGCLAAVFVPLFLFAGKRPATAAAPGAPTAATKSPATAKRAANGRAPLAASAAPAAAPLRPLEKQWGIRVAEVHMSGGGLLEVHYQVVDPGQAEQLLSGKVDVYLLDEASGAKIAPGNAADEDALPMHSRARTAAMRARQDEGLVLARNRLTAGTTYSILIPNPRGVVKKGGRVTLVAGNARMAHLTVL